MGDEESAAAPPPPQPQAQPEPEGQMNASSQTDPPSPGRMFDPSRMIGIIRRKALIKDLAAVYHAECLAYCQELLELQRKWQETCIDIKAPEDPRKDTTRPIKRPKKAR